MSDWYNPFSWGSDPYEDAQDSLAKIEPVLNENYGPYADMASRLAPQLEAQYGMGMTNPAAIQSMLGAGYTQSPGYQYQYDTAMNAGNQQLAAGGMLGTPAAQTQMMGTAQGLANQDYWNYYNQNASLYNQGLEGSHKLFNTGYSATDSLASGLSSLYGNQANLSMAEKQSQDEMFATMIGAGLTAAGYALGGPPGGAAASAATSSMMPSSNSDWMYSSPENYMPIGSF